MNGNGIPLQRRNITGREWLCRLTGSVDDDEQDEDDDLCRRSRPEGCMNVTRGDRQCH